jgi:hypothetical protein
VAKPVTEVSQAAPGVAIALAPRRAAAGQEPLPEVRIATLIGVFIFIRPAAPSSVADE